MFIGFYKTQKINFYKIIFNDYTNKKLWHMINLHLHKYILTRVILFGSESCIVKNKYFKTQYM